ncbi:MAG: peptidylprolyl isomerase [Paracoccaceae bacterium]
MQKYLKTLPALVLACSMALPAVAQDAPTADTVVATVNGEEITLGHMIVARASLPPQYDDLPNEQLFEGILGQLIQQSALAQSVTGDLPGRVTISLENERRQLIAGEAIESALASAMNEAAIKEIYDSQFANAVPGEEYDASHILLETEEEAAAVKVMLDEGADFAATAKDKSTGPSGPGGGSLGWFGAGAMVPEFEAATVALDVGAVSEPIQTQFGWHVIKLNDKRNKPAPTLEEAREDITAQIQQAAFQAKVDEVTKGAEIDRSGEEGLDPALLNALDLLGN